MKGKIADWFVNNYLSFAGWMRAKGFKFIPVHHADYIDKGMMMFIDEFEDLENWDKGLWWGDHHPDERKYTKDENIKLVGTGAELTVKYDPMVYNDRRYMYSTGLLECKQSFSYGYFEVCCSMEIGRDLWYAPLWFVSRENDHYFPVTPELDVCEVYTDSDGLNMHANSDVHYGLDYSEKYKRDLGAKTHVDVDFSWPNIFGCKWSEDSIEIYYNNYLVRRITSERVLSMFRTKLMPIISSGVKNDKVADETNRMIVHWFKYYKNR